MLLPLGLVVLHLLTAGLAPLPPQAGPAPLWVSLLALGIAYAACCAVAAGVGMVPWPRRRARAE
jgi:hypothetical protein